MSLPSPDIHSILKDKQNQVLLGIAILLSIIAFWNVYQCSFVYDDNKQILQNPFIKSTALLPKGLISDVWAFKGGSGANSNYWRPTFVAWMFGNYQAFGEEPAAWHITNLILHLLVIILGFVALIRMRINQYVAGLAIAIFAVHPSKSESVTWVAGATDVLMAAFLFGSIILLCTHNDSKATKSIVGSSILFLFALLSKEVCIMFPFVVALIGRSIFGLTWKSAFKLSIPFFVTVFAFLLARHFILGSSTMGYPDSPSFASMVLSIPTVFVFYLQQTFWPSNLGVLYDVKATTMSQIANMNYLIAIVIMIVAITIMIVLGRKSRTAGFGFAIFFMFLLPAFALKVFKGDDLVHDRYLYLPLIGMGLAIGSIVFDQIFKAREENQRKILIFGSILGCVLALATMKNNQHWMNDVALWEQATKIAPNHTGAFTEYAEVLRIDNQLGPAREAIDKAIELGISRPNTLVVSGLIFKDSGNLGRAETDFQNATNQFPYYPTAWEQLLDVQTKAGKQEDAIKTCEAAEKATPGLKPFWKVCKGIIQFQLGDKAGALESLESVKNQMPGNPDPRVVNGLFLIAELYRDKGDNANALEMYKQFVSASKGYNDERTNQMRQQSEQLIQMLRPN